MNFYGKKIVLIVYAVAMIGWGGAVAFGQEISQSAKTALRVGLIPERNVFKQLERYDPLVNYLSEKLGLEITLKILTRYGNIIDNFSALKLDAAFFGSFTYALAHKKIGVEVIARPESLSGASTYHGLIFVRKDTDITEAAGMAGKTFVFVDKATTAGYLLPIAYFKRNGIQDFRTFLKEHYFAGTHEDAIYDVLNRAADIGAAKNTVFEALMAIDNRLKNELNVIARSPDVPENALAVRKDMNSKLRADLKKTLIGMKNDPNGKKILKNFGASAFIETGEDDYINVYKLAADAGLNLDNYEYLND